MRKLTTLYRDFLAALVIMDPDRGFLLILRNCVRMNGNLSSERVWGEFNRLSKLITVIVVFPLAFLAINLAALWAVHNYVVPLPMAASIFGAFDINPEAWEYNIEHRELGDVGAKYEDWSAKKGFTSETSRFWQETLWHGWPFYLGISLYIGLSFYLIVVKVCLKIVRYYTNGLSRRKSLYYDIDLKELPRDQIIY
jgi:hypothetical protein